MTETKAALAIAAVVIVAGVAGVAHAETPLARPEAIEVDRDTPPPGRVEFGFDGGAPVGAWALGVQLGFLDRPLVLSGAGRVNYPVDHRETLVIGGAVALGPAIVVDARLPLIHQVGDRLIGLGDDTELRRFVTGDLGIGARIRVATPGRLSVFLRGELTLPTGDDYDFASDTHWTAAWMLIARAALPHAIVIAATGGIRLRTREIAIADQVVGDETFAGVGATIGLPPIAGLWCEPEQLKLAAELVGILGDDVANQRGPSPVEARLGMIGQPRAGITIGGNVGIGLDDQIGAPRFRVMLQLAWQAPAPAVHAVPTLRPETEDTDDP